MNIRFALAALLLGILSESLVVGEIPGIGYLLLAVTVLALSMTLSSELERSTPAWNRLLFVVPLTFALAVTTYDAAVVRVFASGLAVVTLLWALAWNLVGSDSLSAMARIFPSPNLGPAKVVASGMRGVKELKASPTEEQTRWAGILWRGSLMAAPLLLVFAMLLASADPIFAKLLRGGVDSVAQQSWQTGLRVLLLSLLALGFLRQAILVCCRQDAERPLVQRTPPAEEVTVALALVNLLFLSFLVVQGHYLFGGGAHVEAWGLNYAHYARKGFFELAACVGLVLPVILVAYSSSWQHQKAGPRRMSGLLVLLTVGLGMSALQRMLLYINVYGLSIERIYAAAGIMVALVLLSLVAWACLRPLPVAWVLSRQLLVALALVAALSLVNVENWVVDYNLGRACENIDYRYLGTLSADALPALYSARFRTGAESLKIDQAITAIESRPRSCSGASFNLARWRASRRGALDREQASTKTVGDEHERVWNRQSGALQARNGLLRAPRGG